MKYFIFFTFTTLFIPLTVVISRLYKPFLYILFSLMILSTAFPESLGINFFSREFYRAATRGIEINLSDLCAFSLFVSLLIYKKEKNIWLPPLSWPIIFYFLSSVFTWLTLETWSAINPVYMTGEPPYYVQNYPFFELGLYPVFELFKILRGFLIFWVCANFTDKKSLTYLLRSFSFIIIYFAILSLKLRYINGEYRVSAGIGHPNDFNTYNAILGSICFAHLFVSDSFKSAFKYAILALLALLTVILTVSRSALFGLCLAFLFSTFFLLTRYHFKRNLTFVLIGMVICLLMFAKASDTLINRFFAEGSYEKAMEERYLYLKKASGMAKDHPLGVGLGNFSAYSILRYELIEGGGSTIAHNIWYLTYAEGGILGLITFIFIWIRAYHLWFLTYLNKKIKTNPFIFGFIAGIFGAFLVIQIQNLYHFSYRQTSIYFVIHILLGILSGIYLLTYKKKSFDELAI